MPDKSFAGGTRHPRPFFSTRRGPENLPEPGIQTEAARPAETGFDTSIGNRLEVGEFLELPKTHLDFREGQLPQPIQGELLHVEAGHHRSKDDRLA